MRAALLCLLLLAGCSDPVTSQGIRVATALCYPHGGIARLMEYDSNYTKQGSVVVDVKCKNGTRVVSTDIPADGL